MLCCHGAFYISIHDDGARYPTDSRPEPLEPERIPTMRRYLMCPPSHFAVRYVINPWMDPDLPVDVGRAVEQWTELKRVYESFGHRVEVIKPQPGLPDMVFAANSGTVVDGRVLGARFRAAQRVDEAEYFRRWFVEQGYREVVMPAAINEAEGDFAWTGGCCWPAPASAPTPPHTRKRRRSSACRWCR